jgi:hypothetical protein
MATRKLSNVTEAKLDTLHTLADTAITDISGVHTDVGTAITDVGTVHTLVDTAIANLATGMTLVEKCIEKSDGAVLNGKDPLFTITGGPILVTELIGIVTTLIGGAANGTLQADVTEPAGTVALCAGAVAIDNDAAGTMYHFVGAAVLTPVTAGAKIVDKASATVGNCNWIIPIGNINFLGSGAQTGVIKWYMTYKPLSPSSVVVAAA